MAEEESKSSGQAAVSQRQRRRLTGRAGGVRAAVFSQMRASDDAMNEVVEFCLNRIDEDWRTCRYSVQRGGGEAWRAFDRLDLEDSIRQAVKGAARNPALEVLHLGELGTTIAVAEMLEHEERWAILTRIAERWWRHPDHQDAWSLSGMRGWEVRMDELRSKDDNSE